MKTCRALAICCVLIAGADAATMILQPARVFDGAVMHEGWAVRVEGDRIVAVGPAAGVDIAGARIVPP